MEISIVQALLTSLCLDNIKILGFREHSKASEKYVDVEFHFPTENRRIEISIPYQYRRCGIFIDTAEELLPWLIEIHDLYINKKDTLWAKEQRELWEKDHIEKTVTKEFFDKLLSLNWCCVENDFPNNPNWARRIQDIKEMGYLLSTKPGSSQKPTYLLLIPRNPGIATGYETWSKALRKRIVKVLNCFNVYEHRKMPSVSALIPDHKFPEIRWDEKTKDENPDTMTDEEIKKKFQLLDNQRNQQKREVCRNCFQTGKRGEIFGIKAFYSGNENWPSDIPKIGKDAEKGCVGCPWYDIETWRNKITKILRSPHSPSSTVHS